MNENGEKQSDDLLAELLAIIQEVNAHCVKLTQLVEDLDNRLDRLESSDFARNRSDYQRVMGQLAEGMPEVPLYAD